MDELIIHVLDVGHGDSIIVEFPGGSEFGIIDCKASAGPNDDSKSLEFLRARCLQARAQDESISIAFFCITHPHRDHFSGAGQLLGGLIDLGIQIRAIWDFGSSEIVAQAMAYQARRDMLSKRALRQYADYYRARTRLDYSSTRIRTLETASSNNPDTICGVKVKAIAPSAKSREIFEQSLQLQGDDLQELYRMHPEARDGNLISSVLELRHGKSVAILGGDATNAAWEEILTTKSGRRRKIRCAGLKASHHGSVRGNFPWGKPICGSLRSDKCLVVAISGNYQYQLPDQETLRALWKAKAKVHVTGSPTRLIRDGREFPPLFWILEPVNGTRGCGDIAISVSRDGGAEARCENTDSAYHPTHDANVVPDVLVFDTTEIPDTALDILFPRRHELG